MLSIICSRLPSQELDKIKKSHKNKEKSQDIKIADTEPVISSVILTTDLLFTKMPIQTTIKIGPSNFTIKSRLSISIKII